MRSYMKELRIAMATWCRFYPPFCVVAKSRVKLFLADQVSLCGCNAKRIKLQ